MKTTQRITALLLAVLMLFGAAPLALAEETPEEFTPINDAWDLYFMHDTLDGKFILMNDIDLTELTALGGDFDNNGHGWTPIGENHATPFKGTFDGNGHTIKGLRIDGIETNYAGLFGYLTGTVKSLVLEDVSISGSVEYMGALAGYCYGGTISGVRVSGTIRNTRTSGNTPNVGGVVGRLYIAMITGCCNSAAVSGRENMKAYVGGLCGYATSWDKNASILRCYNDGIISGKGYIGGIVGYAREDKEKSPVENVLIDDCYNVAQITGLTTDSCAAGICGYSTGYFARHGAVIKRCLNFGAVGGSAQKQAAISIMVTNSYNETCGSISDCYYLRGTAEAGAYGKTDTQATAISLSEALSKRQQTYAKLDFTNVWFLDDSTGVEHPQLIAIPEVTTHRHTYTDTVTPPTCTERGYTTHTCDCGESYVDTYVAALGHDYGAWTQTKAPTCTEKGEKTRTCSRCEATETAEIDKLPHTYTDTVTPPTCTKQGYTTHTCTCGTKYINNYVPALGHDYGAWTQTKAPTCTEKGEEKRTCSRCTAFETREIDKLPHTYTDKVTPPTCTEQGYTTHTCTCGDVVIDTYVNALGHDYGAWTQTKAPTCTEKGEEKRTCSRCTAFETREIDKLPHTYTDAVTPPTCTERGYTTHTCTCGDSYVDTYVPALGHKDGEWKVTKEPTATEDGVRTLYCSECGKAIRTEPIPKVVIGRVKAVKVDDVSLNYKATAALKPQITADDGVKCAFSYSSSNPNAVKVNEKTGEVSGLKKGAATITCTVTDQFGNTFTDTCTVTVNYTWWQWIIVIVLFGWLWY